MPRWIDLTRLEDRFELRCGNAREYVLSAEAILASLVSLCNRLSLDDAPEFLHLHAGAVDLPLGAVLVTAPSGGGKTTLTIALAQRGAAYMSDETVALQGAGSSISTWPKPLSIKEPGRALIEDLFVRSGRPRTVDVAPSASGLGFAVERRATPQVIAFLHQGDPLPPPTPGEAVVLLVGQTMDFERYGPRSLLLLARLASRCSLLRLRRQDPFVMAECIEQDRDESDSPEPEEVAVPNDGDRPTLHAVRIGNELVIRNTSTGMTGCVRDALADRIEANGRLPGTPGIADRLSPDMRQLHLLLGGAP